MDKIRKGILTSANGAVYGIFIIISIYLFFLSIFMTCFMAHTDEHIFYLRDFPILMCGGLIFLCFLFMIWNRKRVEKYETTLKEEKDIALLRKICFLGTIVIATMMSVFIIWMEMPPIHDQSVIFGGSKQFLEGNYYHWEMGNYFSMFSFQNGMVLLLCPFHIVFGENAAYAFQFFNVIMLFMTYYGIAKIAEHYFGRKTMYMTYIGLLLIIPMWSYVTFIYGNIAQFCLSVWAMYFELQYENNEQWKYCIYSGLCIAFAIMCKTNAQLFLLVICIMLLMHAIGRKSIKAIGGLLIIVGIAMISIKGVPMFFHYITGENTTNGIPLIAWIGMGLRESSVAPGWYNEFSVNIYRNISMDPEVISKESLKGIQESINVFMQEKEYMFRFFARKVASMWSDPAFQCFTVINTRNIWGEFPYWLKDLLYNGGIKHTILYLLLDILQSIHYFGVIIYLILRRKNFKLKEAHLIVAVLGGYFYHFFSEGKSQYVLPYYVLLVPYVVEGYRMLIDKLSSINFREKALMNKLMKTGSMKIGLSLVGIILIITLAKGSWITNTVKLGGDENDYIWLCTNRIEWKDDNYEKD